MFPNNSDFESQFTFETAATPIPEAQPFHILVLGDWSGTGSRKALVDRKPIVIDRDNFDEVLQRLNVGIELDLHNDGNNLLNLEFTEIDDFHPDNIYRKLNIFSDLRDVRRSLLNSDTFNETARQVRSWFNVAEENETSVQDVQTNLDDAPPIEGGNLLDLILTQPSESATSAKPQRVDNTELGRLISKIVSPHLIKIDENEQTKLVAAVDEAISELMRKTLHHPQFQALESAWRGLYFLVRRLETDVDLKVFILDISKEELTENLKTVNNLTDSILYRHLISETIETPGGEPFAVVCGNYFFGVNVDDIAALMRLGKLANAADAPFISQIQPESFGAKSFSSIQPLSNFKLTQDSTEEKLWTALRNVSESQYIGLSPMRFLARMPYGNKTDSIESFAFEEFSGEIDHSQFLWANPSFVCALLLAQSYRQNSWEMAQSFRHDVENLPMFIYRENGESKTMPCAEVVLTENLAEIILKQGLIPLLSYRDSDRVRVARFQSISSPLQNLKGRWS